ncbi:hypothetical protein ACSBR2_033002 [Camellia fascicularis]
MARFQRLSMIVLLAILSVQLTVYADQQSPAPAPQAGADTLSPPPPPSPSLSPEPSSPPAPPSNPAPASSPTPSPAASPSKKSPVPAPSMTGDVHESDVNASDEELSGGLKGGQKAGIVLGVIAGVCLVGVGGMVYRKRQQNIQRSQLGNAARREIL